MAIAARSTPDPVAALADLREEAQRFEFFEALRRVECAYPDKPRLGTATRPADEPVRLTHLPSLEFAPTMLAEAGRIPGTGILKLSGYFLGLFGPQGPLPLHLTDYAHDRITNARDSTFAAFADIFHHRMLELFYRAWANARPTVQFDRPERDRFNTYIGALLGLALPSLGNRDAWSDHAKLHFAGLSASATRTRSGLEQLLGQFVELPVRLEECIGHWLPVVRSEYLRLGGDRDSASLGRSTVLGGNVWNCQHKFRVVIGPVRIGEVMQYLPGSPSLARLRAAVMNYVGFEYAWDIRFVIRRERLPGVKLGEFGHLGWTSWVAPTSEGPDVEDVLLDVSDKVTVD